MNTRAPAGVRRHVPNSPFNKPAEVRPQERYAAGDRVNHDRYGMGTVLGLESGDSVLCADFGSGKVLRISLPSAKLTKL